MRGLLTSHFETQQCKHYYLYTGLARKMVVATHCNLYHRHDVRVKHSNIEHTVSGKAISCQCVEPTHDDIHGPASRSEINSEIRV